MGPLGLRLPSLVSSCQWPVGEERNCSSDILSHNILCGGAVLGTVGGIAASLDPVTSTTNCDNQNTSRHCQMNLGGQNCSWLRTTD